MKAQVSVEYAIIIGFVVALTVPLLLIYIGYTDSMNDEFVSSQVSKVVKKIVNAADTVYYLGEPSQTTLNVYIPKEVDEVIISDREVNYKVRTSSGITDIFQIASANMTGTLPDTEGNYFVTVKATGNNVELSYS